MLNSVVLSCHVILSKSIKIGQFEIKNSKIFWGGNTAPSPDPSPLGRGTPLPKPYPVGAFGASFASARAYGARVYLPPCPPPDAALPPWCRFPRSAHATKDPPSVRGSKKFCGSASANGRVRTPHVSEQDCCRDLADIGCQSLTLASCKLLLLTPRAPR